MRELIKRLEEESKWLEIHGEKVQLRYNPKRGFSVTDRMVPDVRSLQTPGGSKVAFSYGGDVSSHVKAFSAWVLKNKSFVKKASYDQVKKALKDKGILFSTYGKHA